MNEGRDAQLNAVLRQNIVQRNIVEITASLGKDQQEYYDRMRLENSTARTALLEESGKKLADADEHLSVCVLGHTVLFDKLSIYSLKHMLRVTYAKEPTGNTRPELVRDVLMARAQADAYQAQKYNPEVLASEDRQERVVDEEKCTQELEKRDIGYHLWCQRAGLHLADDDGTVDEGDEDFEEPDEMGTEACIEIGLLPPEVTTIH